MFEQGDLRFVILSLLEEKPRHGYEIIKALEERFGGTYAPSPGVVYPTLQLLEDQGFARIVPGYADQADRNGQRGAAAASAPEDEGADTKHQHDPDDGQRQWQLPEQ